MQRDITLSPSLYECASDCICAALWMACDLGRCGDLVQILFEGTHSLRDAFHNAVAHEDTDKYVLIWNVVLFVLINVMQLFGSIF